MSNLLKMPKAQPSANREGQFERFQLTENPFPTEPVNKDSSDRRVNGGIYESDIRTQEYKMVEEAFLKPPQTDRNRLRLGYICDTSYIGRGNGKSAFLVNLVHRINKNYCLDISDEVNKCFAIYVTPEPGGRTKTFPGFVDLIFDSMIQSGIIDVSLAGLRLRAAQDLHPAKNLIALTNGEERDIVQRVNAREWYDNLGISYAEIASSMLENPYLQSLPNEFPLMSDRSAMFHRFVTTNDFSEYYQTLHRGRPRLDFVLSHMVQMYYAAGFNGAYVLVDDFERIPDFQTGRQRKDFAIELRSALLDGPYASAKDGFYNMLLVLHAGVPQLIREAWMTSGLGNRYSLDATIQSKHWIPFGKLSRDHVLLLLKKYLTAYRVPQASCDSLAPFKQEAIDYIADNSEFNAARILRTCWDLLEKAAQDPQRDVIDEAFVRENTDKQNYDSSEPNPTIENQRVTNLPQKAREGQS